MREQVRWFAGEMEDKLKKNDFKGGWDGCEVIYLIERIKSETQELIEAMIIKENEKNIIEECADIANFAMMIADKSRSDAEK